MLVIDCHVNGKVNTNKTNMYSTHIFAKHNNLSVKNTLKKYHCQNKKLGMYYDCLIETYRIMYTYSIIIK